MLDLLQLLVDPQGFEVAWDYCLENNIFMPDGSYPIGPTEVSLSYTGKNRVPYSKSKSNAGTAFSGRSTFTVALSHERTKSASGRLNWSGHG